MDNATAIAPSPALDRRAGARRRIAFVTDFYVEEILQGIVEYVREAGWELDANMRFHGCFPTQPQCDGILATVTGGSGDRVRDWLAPRTDVPIVRMAATRLDLPYPAVEADYRGAGTIAARHLMELGHVHYAIFWIEDIPELLELRDGFESALAPAGQRLHRLQLPMDLREAGREGRSRWLAGELKRLPRPLAVMSDDDRRALNLLDACELAGLRVPEDVAILGCDNRSLELGTARIPFSSVDMNFKRLGWEAAAMLDRLLRGLPCPDHVVKVPPRGVVARRSTATFVTDSAEITAAVLFLREHFHERVRLDVLARKVGLSKAAFRSEFKKHVGRTAREELQRVRLACAARLLRDTDLKLEAVAVESGFGCGKKLCAAFSETYGQSPCAWRQGLKQGS